MTLLVLFSQHLSILGPPNTAKQGKTQNDKSTLFYPPTLPPLLLSFYPDPLILVTRIAATLKSQIASDCNRNSKKSLRLCKHPLSPALGTRVHELCRVVFIVFRKRHTGQETPQKSLRLDYKGVIPNRSDLFAQCDFCQESQIDPWPRYFWKVSRYTSHFYRDTFAKVCPPLSRK